MPPVDRAGLDPIGIAFRGFPIAQLTIGALGVLMISSEYSCGLIRTTFAAAPQRRAVLGAKAVVIGVAALVAGEITSFAAFFLAQGLLSSTGKGLSIADPGTLAEVASAGMYMAVVALIGLALGVLVRHTAGGISALFLLVFVAPNVIDGLPQPWSVRIGEWLPPNLAQQLVSIHPSAEFLSRPWSLVVLLAYPVVFLAAAAWRLSKSDA
jgi:ABC-type transport system involved in multi-copper enzyme maturation permease subunit